MSSTSTDIRVRPLDPDELTLFAAGRYLATRAQPYLSSALFAMTPRAAEGLDTFGVDRRWRLYIDPARLREWSAASCAAVLLHEVGHLVRDHAQRGEVLGVFDPEHHHRWNIAGDLAINDDLITDGAQLPGHPLTPRGLGLAPGLMEEEYYGLLSRPLRADAAGTPDCGSGADGRSRPWELADDDESTPGLPHAAVTALRIQVAAAVREAGNVPAGWRRWAEAAQDGRSDWRRVLRTAITRPRLWRAGRLDVTWQRPDRREDARPGLVLPGTRAPRFEIAVIIDTSASVTDSEVSAALAEVTAVQRQCGVRQLWAIACDAEPSPPQRVRVARAIDLPGGGGTDLRPAIALLPRLRPRPDVAIVITDGWTPWPDRPPKGIALVVATTDRPCPTPGVRTVQIELTQP